MPLLRFATVIFTFIFVCMSAQAAEEQGLAGASGLNLTKYDRLVKIDELPYYLNVIDLKDYDGQVERVYAVKTSYRNGNLLEIEATMKELFQRAFFELDRQVAQFVAENPVVPT